MIWSAVGGTSIFDLDIWRFGEKKQRDVKSPMFLHTKLFAYWTFSERFGSSQID